MGITEPIVIVIIIFVVITLMALRRRILFRMGLRNLTRRKSQTAVVILGLLIGTAIISSSLVIGDTLEYIFVDDVIDKLDAIDELVYDRPPRTGEYPFFNISTFTVLKDSLESNNTPIDGIAPLIIKQVGVSYIEEDTVEGGVTLMGFNASQEEGFGSFKGLEDEVVDEGLALNNTIINERLSEKLNADTGGTIAVRFGDNTTYLTVEYIVENEGKGNWEKTSCIFVSLETAQTIFDNQSGKINAIKISNRGGVVEGVDLWHCQV